MTTISQKNLVLDVHTYDCDFYKPEHVIPLEQWLLKKGATLEFVRSDGTKLYRMTGQGGTKSIYLPHGESTTYSDFGRCLWLCVDRMAEVAGTTKLDILIRSGAITRQEINEAIDRLFSMENLAKDKQEHTL